MGPMVRKFMSTFGPLKLRYTFQALVHSLRRERNARRQREQPRDVKVLIKCVDKTIRLKLLPVKGKAIEILGRGVRGQVEILYYFNDME
ncbi:hypothetical protein YC2023_042273 [Brassica napus]